MISTLIRPLLGLCAILSMGIVAMTLLTSRPGVRLSTGTSTAAESDPRQRGEDYEDHVLDDAQLPRVVVRARGTLKAHPRIHPPGSRVPARYYQCPDGFDGGAIRDGRPHPSAASRWSSTERAPYRIPDAIATYGRLQVLHEFKCQNPWLIFAGGLAWAAKMQARFGAQATAFLAWAAERPETREVVYGFCGLASPWARAILDDLKRRFPLARLRVEEGYFADDFEPAARLMHRAARAAMLTAIDPPTQAVGPTYDRLKD